MKRLFILACLTALMFAGGGRLYGQESFNYDKMINFEEDKSILEPASYKHLDILCKIMLENEKYWVTIDSHTDDTRPEEYCDKLSQDRADAIKNYLLYKGIDASRIIARGHGLRAPLVPNTSMANRAKNRRVEVRLEHLGLRLK